MTKSRKNINAFSEALRSNTKEISSKNKSKTQPKKTGAAKSSTSGMTINSKLEQTIFDLSKKYNMEPKKMTEIALEMFIDLEKELFR